MSIATSLDKLSETLTNCKTNLKEKKVENVDSIKISDVDEKIAEIQAGGGSDGFKLIENVTFNSNSITKPLAYYISLAGDDSLNTTLEFTPKVDNVQLFVYTDYLSDIKIDNSAAQSSQELEKREYSIFFDNLKNRCFLLFATDINYMSGGEIGEWDSFIIVA